MRIIGVTIVVAVLFVTGALGVGHSVTALEEHCVYDLPLQIARLDTTNNMSCALLQHRSVST